MARSFIVYQGEDETPEFDLTEPTSPVHVIWPEIEAGGRAFRGEANTSSIPIRDEQGETGNELNLPSGLDHISLSRGSQWIWMDGPDGSEVVMARGRIGVKDYSRGRQKADRAREVVVQCGDVNEDLQGILVDAWSRPEETDVARVLALLADYLDGDPRATTTITDDYVAAGNTVTMPAKTYDGTSPHAILAEIAQLANKNFFITVDRELWYDTWDSTTYPAGIRISDREDEWHTEGACHADEFAALGSLGSATTNTGDNFPSDFPDWAGDNEERVEIAAAFDVPAGYSLIGFVSSNIDGAQGGLYPHKVYDEQGNTWTRDAQSPDTGSENYTTEIWSCNVTNAIGAGDYIRFAMNLGASLNVTSESGVRTLGVLAFSGTLSGATAGTEAEDFGSSPAIASSATADLVVVAASGHYATADDPDWEDGFSRLDASAGDKRTLYANYLMPGANEPYSFSVSQNSDWTITSVGYTTAAAGAVLTFPPKWDVGPSSTEDGLQLRCGVRLYYGIEGDFVEVHDDTTHNEYWHSEESLYTSDPAIDDATKATALATAILDRRKREERTYNVSIGPLSAEQVGCIKYGQLIDIKARAIPDADDQFVSRRIAQLRWTTPRPGVFWARMQLDRPIKEEPYGVGPKTAMEMGEKVAAVIAAHTADTSDAHDASAISVLDTDGNFTGTNVEAVLDELFDAIGGGVTDHGALTGLGDDDHTQYVLRSILTTKGDIFVRTSGGVSRLGVGSDGQIPYADSSQSTGIKWADAPTAAGGGAGEILVSDSPAGSPLVFSDLLQNEDGTDLLYADTGEGGSGGVSDHGSLTGLGDLDHDQYVRAMSSGAHQIIAGVIRKSSGTWELLTGTHHPIGLGAVTATSTTVEIDIDPSAVETVSVVVGPDETYAEDHTIGASVSTTKISLKIYQNGSLLNPTTMPDSGSGNFWILGIMEV